MRRSAYLEAVTQPTPKARLCPICRKPTADRFQPFCSGRCKDVDLHRWFSGNYAIPGAETDEESVPKVDAPRLDED